MNALPPAPNFYPRVPTGSPPHPGRVIPGPDAVWRRLALREPAVMDAEAITHWLKCAAVYQRFASAVTPPFALTLPGEAAPGPTGRAAFLTHIPGA